MEVGGPWVDQRGEFAVFLSTRRAQTEAEVYLQLRQGGAARTVLA